MRTPRDPLNLDDTLCKVSCLALNALESLRVLFDVVDDAVPLALLLHDLSVGTVAALCLKQLELLLVILLDVTRLIADTLRVVLLE